MESLLVIAVGVGGGKIFVPPPVVRTSKSAGHPESILEVSFERSFKFHSRMDARGLRAVWAMVGLVSM